MLFNNRIHKVWFVAGLFLMILLTGCHEHDHHHDWDHSTETEDLDYTFDSEDISFIDARTTNGTIDVNAVSGHQGIILVHKEVRADTEREAEDFAELVDIHFVRTHESLHIYTTYPRPWDGVTVEVSYKVECNRETDLTLLTVNGGIEISGTKGAANVVTTNGNIEASLHLTNGRGRFNSTNGGIEVSVGRCTVPLTAQTVNGWIDLELADDFSGLLDARTVNGRVRCGIPLSEIDVETIRVLTGRIGEGRDTPISLDCVNGSIRISEY